MSEKKAKKSNSLNDVGKIESLIIFKCNCRCVMCSTGLQIDRSVGSTNYQAIRPVTDVIADIDKAKKSNASGFAFSGGEATLRNDLPFLVSYAKSVGLNHIEVQSNGKRYVYKDYCKKLIDKGVNNFVISLHSHKEKVHDKMMGTPGTFKQATEGIKNLNELGQSVKINIVLTKFNTDHLEEHVKFLLKFNIEEIRFTMCMLEGNVMDDPKGIVEKMSVVGPHICDAIDIVAGRVGCFVYNMVPCLLPGHEDFVNDLGQLDTVLIGPDFETSLDDARKGKKIKAKCCKKCKYNPKCYGVWKKYVKIFGTEELKAVKE